MKVRGYRDGATPAIEPNRARRVTGRIPPAGSAACGLAAVVALGAVGTGPAYALDHAIVRDAGPTTASTVTYLIPIVATLAGVVLLGDPLGWEQPLGTVVVLVGAALAQGRLRRRSGRRDGAGVRRPGHTVRVTAPPSDHLVRAAGTVRLLNTAGGRALCLAGSVDEAAVADFTRRYGREPARVDVVDARSVTSLCDAGVGLLREHLAAARRSGRTVALHRSAAVERLLPLADGEGAASGQG